LSHNDLAAPASDGWGK